MPGERERLTAHNLAGLEHTIAHRESVVERRYSRGVWLDEMTVDPNLHDARPWENPLLLEHCALLNP
jgi:hypothetical protein